MTATRRGVILAMVGLLTGPLRVGAQSPARAPRIAVLGDVPRFLDEAFRQGLRELGYVEGQNIVIEHRAPGWQYERLPALAAELARSNIDVIVAASPPATEAARRATTTIPIVFTVSADPVAEGFVASLARPGGNVTGLATMSAEVVGKQLGMLKTLVPAVTRVALLRNPQQPAHAAAVRQADEAARALGIQVDVVEAHTSSEIDGAFVTIRRQRAGALLVLRDAAFRAQGTQIIGLAAKHRLPAMYGLREEAEAGGLMAYGASVPHNFRRAATYVDRILKGTKPADLPVEQPTTFELVMNLKTARTLGITVPRTLLNLADKVIE